MSFVFVVSGHNIGKGKLREIYAIWYSVIYEYFLWYGFILSYVILKTAKKKRKENKPTPFSLDIVHTLVADKIFFQSLS